MIIFLYGPDGFRIRQHIQQLCVVAINAQTPCYRLDMAELGSPVELHNLLRSQGLFANRRMIILEHAFAAATTVIEILKNNGVATDNETELIIFESESKTKLTKQSKELYNIVTGRNTKTEEFELLTDTGLAAWVRARCKEAGITIAVEAVTKLVANSKPPGGSKKETEAMEPLRIGRLNGEVDKLISYVLSKELLTITVMDVQALAAYRENPQTFVFIDNLFVGETGVAAGALHALLRSGENEQGLLALVLYQLRLVAKARGLLDSGKANADALGVHPFVARKALQLARRYSVRNIQHFYQTLLAADLASKDGRGDHGDALWHIVFSARTLHG